MIKHPNANVQLPAWSVLPRVSRTRCADFYPLCSRRPPASAAMRCKNGCL